MAPNKRGKRVGWLFCWLGEGIAFGSPVSEGVGAAVDIGVHGEVVVVQSVEDGCAKENIHHGRKKYGNLVAVSSFRLSYRPCLSGS